MRERLIFILLLTLGISLTNCANPGVDSDGEDYDQELRAFNEYETWKPAVQPAPEVILIKQKDPHHHHDNGHSIGSILKHNLPLWAVLAPLVAVSVLLPLKAYIGPSYVVYPPVTAAPPAAPPSTRDRVGKVENDILEEQSISAQILSMIEEFERVYGEINTDDEDS